jgi:hypothetical protein
MSFWGCGQGTTKHDRWGAVAWLDDGKSIHVLIESFEDMCTCMCVCVCVCAYNRSTLRVQDSTSNNETTTVSDPVGLCGFLKFGDVQKNLKVSASYPCNT